MNKKILVFCLGICLVSLILQHFFFIGDVPSKSMEPAIKGNSYIFVRKSKNIKRQDIVIFRHKNRNLVKRCIGIPKDKITVKQNGNVYVNDVLLKENYIKESYSITDEISVTLKNDEYWVMGDNRNHSTDSRTFGPIKLSDIVGKI